MRSLRKELLQKFVVALMTAQLFFTMLGFGVVHWLLVRQREAELALKSRKALELFGALARYGDVRYAKFVVQASSAEHELLAFRVYDLTGEEIQATPPHHSVPAKGTWLAAAQRESERRARNAHLLLDHAIAGTTGSYAYHLATADGASYLVSVTMRAAAFPWAWTAVGTLGVVLLSLPVAIAVSRKRIRKASDAIQRYSYQVRKLGLDDEPDLLLPPYAELTPIQHAMSGMVRDLREQAKLAGVGRLTQMLAHDVRKPLSLLSLGLDMITRAEGSPDQMLTITKRVKTEVRASLAYVDSLLSDVLEVSAASAPMKARCSLADLVDQALTQVLRFRKDRPTDVACGLRHEGALEVDQTKILRVLANVLDNAVAATGAGGRIWITSRNVVGKVDGPMVEVTVGNSGSFVPHEERARIFEAFFTKGKKGGTGLGLAIARKLVIEHGGTIRCESELARGTEFVMTLPASHEGTGTLKPNGPMGQMGSGTNGASFRG